MSSLLVGFFGFFYFNSYLNTQAAKSQETEELLAVQQKLLTEAKEDIAALKEGGQSAFITIQEDAQKQITEIQRRAQDLLAEQQRIINELKLPVKYTQQETNLIQIANTRVIRSVASGTRVIVYSESRQYSTVKVGSQQGRILTQHLADNAPLSVPDLSVIVRQWRPNMAYIICNFRQPDTGKIYLEKTGSGTVFAINNGYSVVTNKHVISDDKGTRASACNFKFPGSSHVFSAGTSAISISTTHDWGLIQVPDLTTYIPANAISRLIRCGSPQDGDEVAIIGYPEIGSQTDITTTRGILSGRDGVNYITDAKIDFGNSGGAAIHIKSNCYLGIPTFSVVGGVESLGRILDAAIVFGK